MRNTLLLFTFLSIIFNGNSQIELYQPYSDNLPQWRYQNGGPELRFSNIHWEGDTVVNQTRFTKMFNHSYIGGVMQDTVNKKTYFLDLENNSHDVTLKGIVNIDDTVYLSKKQIEFYLPTLYVRIENHDTLSFQVTQIRTTQLG